MGKHIILEHLNTILTPIMHLIDRIDANKVDNYAFNNKIDMLENTIEGLADNVPSIDGLATEEFVNDKLSLLIGDAPVSVQITSAINKIDADDLGVYVQDTEPANAVAGDIWIDTTSNPAFITPSIPEITAADNGKMLMVVNGSLQLVDLNLSIDANGVVSV